MNFHLRCALFKKSRRLPVVALPLTAAGLIAMALPVAPASALNLFRNPGNGYETCASRLREAGIAEAEVAAACAAALNPEDLSECVIQIDRETEVQDLDALSGCRRVRRPLELATCVVDISRSGTEGTTPLDILDNCRRSLLPERFSDCVVGLRSELSNFATGTAMSTCIAANGRSRSQGLRPAPVDAPDPVDTPGLDAPPAEPPATAPTTPGDGTLIPDAGAPTAPETTAPQ